MLWILRVMLVLWPGLALAQGLTPVVTGSLGPAEPPPPDFPARQFIDSKGCVFLRTEDDRWQARVARDGAPICGYPPTLSVRGLGGKPKLRALDPDAGRSRAELLERALSQTVLTNLRPGELVSDSQPMEKLPDLGPEPMPTGPAQELQAAIAAAPALRQDMGGGLKPNLRLCELLGYDGKAGPTGMGRDPSQGYCNSLPEADLSRLSFARPIGSSTRDKHPDARPAEPASDTTAVVPALAEPAAAAKVAATPKPKTLPARPTGKVQAAAKPADTPARSAPAKPQVGPDKPQVAAAKPQGATAKPQVATAKTRGASADPAKTALPQVGMIPAGARYVQLGTFADTGNADRAAQRVAGLGYPVLRGKDRVNGRPVQFIMAGPFPDRESIVRGLDAIRRAGYRDAFPR